MTNTATAPKPAAPKANSVPKPAAPAKTPKQLDNVPETDAKVEPQTAPAPRGGNSAYADEETRANVTKLMAHLRAKGFTRPSISAVTGFSDSQVWRAQNDKVHATEVETLLNFAKDVEAGKIQPPANGVRKPKVGELEAKINAVIAKIAELPEKANVTALRKALAEVKATLEA